jgi:hypothetical protein
MFDSTEWLIIIGPVGIGGFLAAWRYRGAQTRRRVFKGRSSLPEEAWFRRWYPVDQSERENVRRILSALANEIGVEWTKLRPSDTFEGELRIHPRYLPYDDLNEAECKILSLAEALKLSPADLPGFTGTLGGFLDQWTQLSGGEPPSPVAANRSML